MSRDDRKFVVTLVVAFGLLAGIALWRGRQTPATVLGAVAGALIVIGLLLPRAIPSIRKAWMSGAHGMSRVTTPIILGVVYYLVLTPVGLLRRALRGVRDRSPRFAQGDTAWVEREVRARPPGDMKRQF